MHRMIVAPPSIFDKWKEIMEDNKHLSDLDLEMKKILYSKKMNDFTKWQNYRQVLLKYLLCNKQKRQMFSNFISKGSLVKTSSAIDSVMPKNIKVEKIKRDDPGDDDPDDDKTDDEDNPMKTIEDLDITPIKNISGKRKFYHDLSTENAFESASEFNHDDGDDNEIGLNSTMTKSVPKAGRVLRSQKKQIIGTEPSTAENTKTSMKWTPWYK